MKFIRSSHTNTPGVSPVLLRWSGDKDFAEIRDVTQYASWLPEFDPANWLCDPGTTEFVWRIVRAGIFARMDTLPAGTDPEPFADGRPLQNTAHGVVRNGIMYRTVNYLNASDYQNGQYDYETSTSAGALGLGFDILGFWNWKGIDDLTGSPVVGDWILEMATLRIGGVKTGSVPFDSCGQIDWRGDSADRGSVGQSTTQAAGYMLSIARWSGDSKQPDVPRSAPGSIIYGANGNYTPWGYDSTVVPCVDDRPRWDHTGTYRLDATTTRGDGFTRESEDIDNCSLDNVDSIVLCNGRFSMTGSTDPQKIGDTTIVTNDYVPSGYTPNGLGRLREWLDSGVHDLYLSAYWFGNDDVGARPSIPGDSCGNRSGIYVLDVELTHGAFVYLQPNSMPMSKVAEWVEYPVVSGIHPDMFSGGYPGTIAQRLVDDTNRVLNGLGLSIQVENDHGISAGGSGGPAGWNHNVHFGVSDINILSGWPADLDVKDIGGTGGTTLGSVHLMPVTGGTVIATGKLIQPGNGNEDPTGATSQMMGSPRRAGALPEPLATRVTSGSVPLVVMETVGQSRVFFCPAHTVSYL
jgi:hypothetical protein